jgi:hypothetical protein
VRLRIFADVFTRNAGRSVLLPREHIGDVRASLNGLQTSWGSQNITTWKGPDVSIRWHPRFFQNISPKVVDFGKGFTSLDEIARLLEESDEAPPIRPYYTLPFTRAGNRDNILLGLYLAINHIKFFHDIKNALDTNGGGGLRNPSSIY